jgi:hypothetical protein
VVSIDVAVDAIVGNTVIEYGTDGALYLDLAIDGKAEHGGLAVVGVGT